MANPESGREEMVMETHLHLKNLPLKIKKELFPYLKNFPKQACVFFCLDAKERKNQGCESLAGGLFIDAAPFQWSNSLILRKKRPIRCEMLP
ncbi:MAG: hypothetical protein JJU13_12415 [Balneolaceae bacterium]|nr:hypothetical protein [Balneolaceae bacterium]